MSAAACMSEGAIAAASLKDMRIDGDRGMRATTSQFGAAARLLARTAPAGVTVEECAPAWL
jgi:hypothetical protein